MTREEPTTTKIINSLLYRAFFFKILQPQKGSEGLKMRGKKCNISNNITIIIKTFKKKYIYKGIYRIILLVFFLLDCEISLIFP